MSLVRCACGCGLPTSGTKYRRGHNNRVVHPWAQSPKRLAALRQSIEGRRAHAHELYRLKQTNRDFTAAYFALFEVVKQHEASAELEVIVEVPDVGYRAIDTAIPALKLGWEMDGGHRYHLSTAADSTRDQQLRALGWTLVHCKTVPMPVEVAATIAAKRASEVVDEGGISG